jgi:hypothetical protein
MLDSDTCIYPWRGSEWSRIPCGNCAKEQQFLTCGTDKECKEFEYGQLKIDI